MANMHPNHIAANARQQAIKAAEREAIRTARRNKKLFWVFIIVGGIGGLIHLVQESNKEKDAEQAITMAKWNKWVAYRDANCKQVEQMKGLVVGQGKFATVDNATVWECTSGMRYLISENVEWRIRNYQGNSSFIPDVK